MAAAGHRGAPRARRRRGRHARRDDALTARSLGRSAHVLAAFQREASRRPSSGAPRAVRRAPADGGAVARRWRRCEAALGSNGITGRSRRTRRGSRWRRPTMASLQARAALPPRAPACVPLRRARSAWRLRAASRRARRACREGGEDVGDADAPRRDGQEHRERREHDEPRHERAGRQSAGPRGRRRGPASVSRTLPPVIDAMRAEQHPVAARSVAAPRRAVSTAPDGAHGLARDLVLRRGHVRARPRQRQRPPRSVPHRPPRAGRRARSRRGRRRGPSGGGTSAPVRRRRRRRLARGARRRSRRPRAARAGRPLLRATSRPSWPKSFAASGHASHFWPHRSL